MKKTLLFAALLPFPVMAQKVKPAAVPAPVKSAFEAAHPGIHPKWEKEKDKYEAEFSASGTETSELYEASGRLAETEVDIAVSTLPAGVSAYITSHFPGKKIKEAGKITDAAGVVTYEAEIGGTDYIFDTGGNFLRSEKE